MSFGMTRILIASVVAEAADGKDVITKAIAIKPVAIVDHALLLIE